MKKTAIQQLLDDLYDTDASFGSDIRISRTKVAAIVRKFLYINKQQIEDAFADGYNESLVKGNKYYDEKDYFNKTYSKWKRQYR